MSTVLKNKKVVAGVGIAAAAAAVLAIGAGTFAAYSATEDGPTTTIAAGTLKFGKTLPGNINIDPLAPNESVTKTFSYTNAGTEPGKFTLSFTGVTEKDHGCEGDEVKTDSGCKGNGNGDLFNKLNVMVKGGNGDVLYGNQKASNLRTETTGGNFVIEPGKTRNIEITFTFPNGDFTDNQAQGDTADIATEVQLVQAF